MKLIKYRGFTIIEVIIVLVIGAFIMITVFAIVPQVQQSARNNQRKRDAQSVLTALRQYYSTISYPSSSGATDITTQIKNIIRSDFTDPNYTLLATGTSRNYQVRFINGYTNSNAVMTRIEVINGYKCKSNEIAYSNYVSNRLNLLEQESNSNSVAVVMSLEPSFVSGTNNYGRTLYCLDDV
jgi:prepilin-type N-terminal cleavage/methylation domain-containing protein